VLQSSFSDGITFDLFALQQDGLTPSEVDIGGRKVLQALVVSAVIVVLDEVTDVSFEIAWQVVVFQQDAVLQGLVSALDFALGLRMVRCSPDVPHAVVVEPFRQIGGDVARSIVAQEAGFVDDAGLVAA